MANVKYCKSCIKSPSGKNCDQRWNSPSSRSSMSGGNVPKRESYSYKCPNRNKR